MEQVIKTQTELDEKESELELDEDPILNGYHPIKTLEEEEYDDDDDEWEPDDEWNPTEEELKEIDECLRDAKAGICTPFTEEAEINI